MHIPNTYIPRVDPFQGKDNINKTAEHGISNIIVAKVLDRMFNFKHSGSRFDILISECRSKSFQHLITKS